MEQLQPLPRRQRWLGYAECYTLYMLLIVGSMAVIAVWRVAIPAIIVAALGHTNADRLIYDVGILVLGLVLFALLMVGEPYLRDSVPRHQLLRRFAMLALPLVLAGLSGWVALHLALTIAVRR